MSGSLPPFEHVCRPNAFRTTQWSMVIAAGSEDSKVSRGGLERLCQSYWYPIYAFIRRRGYSHEDASDLTQSYFARLIGKRTLAGVEPGVARFRSYLLAGLKNFLINEWDSANRQKRGGGAEFISLDEATAQELYSQELADGASPDKLFERQWALAILSRVLARLRGEFAAGERAGLFDALKPALVSEGFDRTYAEVAAEFGLSEGALRVTIHRTRKRFGELLREEVAETVSGPDEVDAEVRSLIQALGE